jgi:hypothetical protein
MAGPTDCEFGSIARAFGTAKIERDVAAAGDYRPDGGGCFAPAGSGFGKRRFGNDRQFRLNQSSWIPDCRRSVGSRGIDFSSPEVPRKQAHPGSVRLTLPRALVETFYSHIRAAEPLDSLPAVHCAKSVSFGSTLIVAIGKEQTPDLSCGDGGNAGMHDLIRDASRIVELARAK